MNIYISKLRLTKALVVKELGRDVELVMEMQSKSTSSTIVTNL